MSDESRKFLNKAGLQQFWSIIDNHMNIAKADLDTKINNILGTPGSNPVYVYGAVRDGDGRNISQNYVKISQLGKVSGDGNTNSRVVILNSSGQIPSDLLPGFVDDVLEGYYNESDKEFYAHKSSDGDTTIYSDKLARESGKIYVDIDSNKTYRYGGESVAYVEISSSIVVGDEHGQAFDGARGKAIEDNYVPRDVDNTNIYNEGSKVGMDYKNGQNKVEVNDEGVQIEMYDRDTSTAYGVNVKFRDESKTGVELDAGSNRVLLTDSEFTYNGKDIVVDGQDQINIGSGDGYIFTNGEADMTVGAELLIFKGDTIYLKQGDKTITLPDKSGTMALNSDIDNKLDKNVNKNVGEISRDINIYRNTDNTQLETRVSEFDNENDSGVATTIIQTKDGLSIEYESTGHGDTTYNEYKILDEGDALTIDEIKEICGISE